MYEGLAIAVVVPSHNESAHIGQVIRTMPEFVDQIIVIDDCSTDDTSGAAMAVPDDRVTLIRNEKNLGVGGAVLAGHQRALDLGADVSVVMGGDAQMDPAYLPALLDPVVSDGYGFSKANRFFSLTSFSGMPRFRIVGNILLSFITKVASGYWHIFDPQNGYTAIRSDVLRKLPLDSISHGYQFENDLLIYLNILGIRVKDVSIPAVYGTEVSGIKLSRTAPGVAYLLFRGFWRRIFWKYVLWAFSPIALLLFTGMLLVAVGLGVGIWVVVVALGSVSPSAGTVLLAVAPLLLGVQLLLAALVLDIVESPR